MNVQSSTIPVGRSAASSSTRLPSAPRIVAFATKGSLTNEELRLRELLREFDAEFVAFNKKAKLQSLRMLVRHVLQVKPNLLVMEGTGISGGIVCLLARFICRTKYIVSSGDAVGPFVSSLHPAFGPLFALYERLLCRWAAGYIGWTPYLVGRALTFGTARAVTAAGWSSFPPPDDPVLSRLRLRKQLGIPEAAIVIGLVGALEWNRNKRYCYGLELVQSISSCTNSNVAVLVVGAGSGLDHLKAAAGERLGRTVFLTGAIPPEDVPTHLNAMDIASLPQSVDGVGSFRYTTKISEYLTAKLPVITGQIPLAYDLDEGWLWRLPGPSPWSLEYLAALTDLMNSMSLEKVSKKQLKVPTAMALFDREKQVARVTSLIQDVLDCNDFKAG